MKSGFIAALAFAAGVAVPAFADEYGKHPFYLQAISSLRAAEWQPATVDILPRSRGFQQRGLQHVDAALNTARHAIGDVQYRNMQRQ